MQDFTRILGKAAAVLALAGLVLYTALSPSWAAHAEDVSMPTPTPEPTAQYYTISAVGDTTLASYPEIKGYTASFENVVGTNWAYPFANTRDLFAADDCTIINLECSISDLTGSASSTFSFLAPAAAVNILTDGSVEVATMANNHAMDFGQSIYDDTAANLEKAGIAHCGDNGTTLCTTASGLTVGVYAVHNGHYPTADEVTAGVASLREQGAEVIVVCAHWGNEASYYQNSNQEEVAHAAIDAGASIVIGHGPHRLEPTEQYNGGVIFYSLANWIFGGNTKPADMDTAVGQVVIRRDVDGTLSVDSYKVLPARISSSASVNDYCPTLYEEGTDDYNRALSKANGTWTGSNDVIDYSFMHDEADTSAAG